MPLKKFLLPVTLSPVKINSEMSPAGTNEEFTHLLRKPVNLFWKIRGHEGFVKV